jgi:hypothetical protein
LVTISRPDSCSAASDPSSGTLIRARPGWSAGESMVNSSSRAAGSRSESSAPDRVDPCLVSALPRGQTRLV